MFSLHLPRCHLVLRLPWVLAELREDVCEFGEQVQFQGGELSYHSVH